MLKRRWESAIDRWKADHALAPHRVPVVVPTVDHGSFTHGFCAECGWEGPARRARGLAVDDVQRHRAACPGALTSEHIDQLEVGDSRWDGGRPRAR